MQTRTNGRVGQVSNLDVTFYRNGIPTDPYAIRRIDIYVGSVKASNLVAQVILPDPDNSEYPDPLQTISTDPGFFRLPFSVPEDFVTNRMYFDVWRFLADDPGTDGDLDDEDLWLSKCNKFWVFPDGFHVDDGLLTLRLAFEPLDFQFKKGEVRTLEVGVTPLPLYDHDSNFSNPLIPQLTPYISIETDQGELLVDNAAGVMGLRQGSFRTNPFVCQFNLDTSNFLIGTYLYRVRVDVPTGDTLISPDLRFNII